MRTAIDTNILSALWSREPGFMEISEQLGNARRDGALLISPVVYAEALAYPGVSESFVRRFLERTDIGLDFRLNEQVWREAGERFARHALRRRKTASPGPRRILADFFIGAHALFHADRLMTLDVRYYAQDFPELQLYSRRDRQR